MMIYEESKVAFYAGIGLAVAVSLTGESNIKSNVNGLRHQIREHSVLEYIRGIPE